MNVSPSADHDCPLSERGSVHSSSAPVNDRSPLSPECIVEAVPALVLSMGLILLATVLLLMPLFTTDDWAASGRTLSLFVVPFPNSVDQRSETAVSVQSEYKHDHNRVIEYPFLQDAVLLEPHRGNTLTVRGIASDGLCLVSWQLRSDSTEHSLLYEGQLELENTFVVTPEHTGRFVLSLHQDCTDGMRPSEMVRSSFEFPVWVKYVRRPLLSLPDEDREEFEDALHVLWETSTQDGQQLYGSDYKGMDFFAEIGRGLSVRSAPGPVKSVEATTTDYALLSAYLERSLQLVNPRVALNYVDLNNFCFCCECDLQDSLHAREILTALLRDKWPVLSGAAGVDANRSWMNELLKTLAAEACAERTTGNAYPGGLLRGHGEVNSGLSSARAGVQGARCTAASCQACILLDVQRERSGSRGALGVLSGLSSTALMMDPLYWVLLACPRHLCHFARVDVIAQPSGPRARGAASVSEESTAVAWLEGFHFEDRAVRPEELTVAQLEEVLNPAGALYRDYFSFVYDVGKDAPRA